MDVHQKYRLGVRWISRFMRKELWVRAMNRLSPIHGKAILQRFGIPNETPLSWRVFPKFGKYHIAINDRPGAALGSRLVSSLAILNIRRLQIRFPFHFWRLHRCNIVALLRAVLAGCLFVALC